MTRLGSACLVFALALGWPVSASAQVRAASPQARAASYPAVAPRAFVVFSQQQFAAKDTFEAIFGDSTGPFRGGGVDVVVRRNIFVEVGFARFERTGERVFRYGGDTFKLGIPLTVKIRELDLTAGYRMTGWRRVVPYGGIGLGSHRYQETSDFAAAGDSVSVGASGLVLVGGVEVRLARFIGVTADAHYSRIHEVIGKGGISQQFGEGDLGGTSARFRIIIGR